MSSLSTPSKPREAKLFRNNRSQAVRIPVEFEMPGDRVLIRREGFRPCRSAIAFRLLQKGSRLASLLQKAGVRTGAGV